jgi:hypothetical protein
LGVRGTKTPLPLFRPLSPEAGERGGRKGAPRPRSEERRERKTRGSGLHPHARMATIRPFADTPYGDQGDTRR